MFCAVASLSLDAESIVWLMKTERLRKRVIVRCSAAKIYLAETIDAGNETGVFIRRP
jgi:hypothetical protein